MTTGRFADLAKDRKKYLSIARRLARCLRDLVDGYDESKTRQRGRELLAEFDELDQAREEVWR